MPDQKNLILAIVLSVTIILAFQYFYELPRIQQAPRQQEVVTSEQPAAPTPAPGTLAPTPPGVAAPATTTQMTPEAARSAALEDSERVEIANPRVVGSLALTGGRFDHLVLSDYRQTIAPNSPDVILLSPPGAPDTYFVEVGWVAADGATVPGRETAWQADADRLTADQPVTLSWDNGEGLQFTREMAIDDSYMLSFTQRVENASDGAVTLHPYGLISRWGTPKTLGFYILHEGPIGVLNGTLEEIDYDDLIEDGDVQLASTGGWLGITDKYWLTALIPDQASPITGTFRHTLTDGQDRYQVDYLGTPVTIPPGGSVAITNRLFAGAKVVELLDRYEAQYGIPLFDRAVDFGWFYFLTKPLFHVLHFFYGVIGNYGVAILLLTLLVKLLFFPLANKSYRAMSKMKKLQPKMVELREKYGEDKAKMNQELMGLYKKEGANPMAGCLPIVVQIPVFFALYKVLFVSIEMRQAPFFGWIHDLSAPDPATVFNLFGLLPITLPTFLAIGVWPLLMGATMLLQTKLNPQPADPVQAKVMMMLPLMFIFLFATFPAGLVIYWTWNNILSIGQQWAIMRRMGVST